MITPPLSWPPYTDKQRREAAEWFIIIRADQDPPVESIQAWLRWMNQQVGNRAAFDAMVRAWHDAAGSSVIAMPSDEYLIADDYDGEGSVDAWLKKPTSKNAPSVTPVASLTNGLRFPALRWLAAASFLVAALVLLAINYYSGPHGPDVDQFITKNGEQIEIALSDGSHVWLGPASTLRVAFDKTRRGIQLLSGEAFFSVRKDPKRPFVVESAGGEIVAVGTEFNVRTLNKRLIVSVSKGVVAITQKSTLAVGKPASVRAVSGEEVFFTAQQPSLKFELRKTTTLGERARWREGILVYRNEPLKDVISDVVRHSKLSIEIVDPEIANLRYSGVIHHDAVQEWLAALPESFHVTVVSESSQKFILTR